MKHEWKKHEKNLYLPKDKPELIIIPPFNYFQLSGQGNPNDAFFSKYIETLYTLSYAVKMSPKKGKPPEGYFEYTVYPLEGIWDLTDQAKNEYAGKFDKNDLVFNLMIRQPDFVTTDFADDMIMQLRNKMTVALIDKIKFGPVADGKCIQIMHLGTYDSEPATFQKMDKFCRENHLLRIAKCHREIYLSDTRKVAPEKLKTVLRYQVS